MIITFQAPGRVVLFGEHQDYLELPVIPAAIDLYMRIQGKRSKSEYHVELPDIDEIVSFSASHIVYRKARDYIRSGVLVLQREGIIPTNEGVSATVTSKIPMQAGISSSSALNVIWIAFLAENFNQSLTPMEITRFAHEAEVLEFNEPGGMQDHMAIAHGFVNFEEFNPIRCTQLQIEFPGIVIGNSLEKKDTLTTLALIKKGVKDSLEYLGVSTIRELTFEDVKNLNPKKDQLNIKSFNMLKAAVLNFEITKIAHKELIKEQNNWDKEFIGKLMTQHHTSLRDFLQVSTPKIEKMITAAMEAGAFGCKITGSGNGGCMIAFCPGFEEEVSRAMKRIGAQTHIVKVVPGVSRIIRK